MRVVRREAPFVPFVWSSYKCEAHWLWAGKIDRLPRGHDAKGELMPENRNPQDQNQGNRQQGQQGPPRQREDDDQDRGNRMERERTQGREQQGTRSEHQGENKGQGQNR